MAYATELLEKLISKYKKTGVNDFDPNNFIGIGNCDEMIEELKRLKIVTEDEFITQHLHFTDDFIKENI